LMILFVNNCVFHIFSAAVAVGLIFYCLFNRNVVLYRILYQLDFFFLRIFVKHFCSIRASLAKESVVAPVYIFARDVIKTLVALCLWTRCLWCDS
jgi:hypothetical protein